MGYESHSISVTVNYVSVVIINGSVTGEKKINNPKIILWYADR